VTWIKRLVVIVAGTYVAVCVFVFFFQNHLLYFPDRTLAFTPADVGLPFEDLTLTTADGVSLSAWYVPAEKSEGSVIICHGNAGNIGDRIVTLKVFREMGFNALIFDYRGYGRSEGSPNEEGTYLDAEAAWAFLTQEKGESPDRIVLYGRSLGGAVAIELARRHEPAVLVVECTFTSIVDVARIHFPLLPAGLLCRNRYESIDKVPHIKCPKIFYHGQDDALIPIELSRRLYEAAAEPKQFIDTLGGHNVAGFLYNDQYAEQFANLLSALLSGADD
jgi:fermentation-respiration switch protein FrsA (DUF1100 family)